MADNSASASSTAAAASTGEQQQNWKAPPEGSPCWVEISARDVEKLKTFYASLFPSWTWRPNDDSSSSSSSTTTRPEPSETDSQQPSEEKTKKKKKNEEEEEEETHLAQYTFAEPKGLSGGIVKMPEACGGPVPQTMGSGMTVYYFVKDLEETEKKVHELGGTTCLPKTQEGKNGFFMNFRDVEGNRFGTYQVA